MKKLINRPEAVVRESLIGMAAAHSDTIRVHFDPNFVYRADAPVQGRGRDVHILRCLADRSGPHHGLDQAEGLQVAHRGCSRNGSFFEPVL